MGHQWPVQLTSGRLLLRPLTWRDARQWHEVRRRNASWLREWEATLPATDPTVPATYGAMIRSFRREARAGRSQAFALVIDGRLVGQITLGGIAWGSLRSAYIGYWIDRDCAGHGYMSRAAAMVTDHAFDSLQLHRIEINIRPENQASRRVAEKLGYRLEGERRAYLHINGGWRDHLSYAMVAQERPRGGLLRHIDTHGWRDADKSGGQSGDTGESVPQLRPPHP